MSLFALGEDDCRAEPAARPQDADRAAQFVGEFFVTLDQALGVGPNDEWGVKLTSAGPVAEGETAFVVTMLWSFASAEDAYVAALSAADDTYIAQADAAAVAREACMDAANDLYQQFMCQLLCMTSTFFQLMVQQLQACLDTAMALGGPECELLVDPDGVRQLEVEWPILEACPCGG